MGFPDWARTAAIGLAGVALGAGGVFLQGGLPTPAGGDRATSHLTGAPPSTTLERTHIERLLAGAEAGERARILASDEAFRGFVEQEARNQSVLIAAFAQAADANPTVQTLMQRAAQRVLVEAYLGEKVRAQLTALDISDEQVAAYYNANPDQFRLPERVHLWQIFLPAESSTERLNAQALGRQLLETLLAHKADFATLARRHSGHPQSRLNGGYMGLMALTDLKPEVRQAVTGATPEVPVGPVETPDGFHLLLRGDSVPGTTLSLEDAAPQVREFLRREALAKARADAVAQMTADHPVEFPAERLAEWRQALLTLSDGGTSNASP